MRKKCFMTNTDATQMNTKDIIINKEKLATFIWDKF